MRGIPGSRRTVIPCCEVERIREHYATGFYSTRELAELWSTTQSHIQAIVSGRSRKNCGGPTTAPEPKVYLSLGAFLAGE